MTPIIGKSKNLTACLTHSFIDSGETALEGTHQQRERERKRERKTQRWLTEKGIDIRQTAWLTDWLAPPPGSPPPFGFPEAGRQTGSLEGGVPGVLCVCFSDLLVASMHVCIISYQTTKKWVRKEKTNEDRSMNLKEGLKIRKTPTKKRNYAHTTSWPRETEASWGGLT